MTAPRHAHVNGIDIAYRIAGSQNAEAVLLVPGVGARLSDRSDMLTRALVGRGYRVITYDSRDSGASTHMDRAGAPDWRAIHLALVAGQAPPVAYTARDLAADAVGLLDALGIRRAHVVGGSLGGMVAQIVAAEYPDRTLSLTSISSSTGNPSLPVGVAPSPASGAGAVARQGAAAAVAGDRRSRLHQIAVPTLVIHGDADPVFPLEHGKDTAENIPGAELRIMPGMGHELPDLLVPTVADAIDDLARKARGETPTPAA